jgi:hypothetical protein
MHFRAIFLDLPHLFKTYIIPMPGLTGFSKPQIFDALITKKPD